MTLQGATVLVSGGTGFLGSHLVRRLASLGARVHVVVRQGRPLDRLVDVRPRPAIVRLDLEDEAGIVASLRSVRPDVVFLAAGSTSERGRQQPAHARAADESYQANVTGPLRLLRALSREAPRARVVRVGSIAEYGTGPMPAKEGQREEPASPYAASLVEATHLGQALYRETGLAVTTLRVALTYGPAQSESFLIPSLICACLDGRPFDLTSASHTRDLVYVGDVIDALLASAVAEGVAGEVVNIGSGREDVIQELAERIVRLSEAPIELRSVNGQTNRQELQRLVCDPERARRWLGWQAQTPLEQGLERTIAWYRAARMS